MRLEIGAFHVKDIQFGDHTGYKAGILTVSNIWLEPGVRQTKKLSGMIDSAVQRLAKFNGCTQAEE